MLSDKKIETLALFPILDELLIDLLTHLSPEEWNKQTVAKLWKVKDVASHLLDGNLRGLSISRDRYFGEKADHIKSYADLVGFLNELNLSWTSATKRLSPAVLTWLLKLTGESYSAHLKTLVPTEDAVFSVAWAGQETSANWFHIAREYTEKFLHQQQIRDAVGKPGLLTKALFYPFIDTLMYAFAPTFKAIAAEEGTVVSILITTEIGGQWNIIKTDGDWILNKEPYLISTASVSIDPDTAWKLFSKSWKPEQVVDMVEIAGNRALAEQVLKMVAVMA